MALLLLPLWWALVPAARGTPWAYWSRILAEPAVAPDATVIRQHVCSRPALYGEINRTWGPTHAAAWFCASIGRAAEGGGTGADDGECPGHPEFDGLGHFIYRHVGERLQHPTVPEVWYKSVYLRDVHWGGALKSSDLYCHQRNRPDKNNTLRNISALLQTYYTCNVIPPIGAWFQLEGKLPSISRAKEWRRRYWAFHDQSPEEDCHPPHKVNHTTLVVSIHVRLGDVLFEAEKPDSKWWYHTMAAGRLAKAKEAFSNALVLASALTAKIRSACGLHVRVVSDTPPGRAASVLGLEFNSSRAFTYRNVTHTIAFTKQGLELDFVGVANPVLTIHCLAKSHILMWDGETNFGRLAAVLVKGLAIDSKKTKKASFLSALQQFRKILGGPAAQCIS